jgi:RNA polymerase sigma-70 factor (ECF subfamily)
MASDRENSSQGACDATFDRAFEELRPAMLAMAYRITGSRMDAEDVVQDAFLRLHRSAPEEAIRSLKAYLTTITARLSLNRLRDLRARRESYIGEWLPEPLPTPDDPAILTEDVSFALLVMLERLSPPERVVFVLKSAFDFSFEEIAPIVGRNPVTCRKLFSRAHARVLEERPRFPIDRERHRALLQSFYAAARGNDLGALLELLSDRVMLRGDGGGKALGLMKPIAGAGAVARFVLALTTRMPADACSHEAELNGAPALVLSSQGRTFVVIMSTPKAAESTASTPLPIRTSLARSEPCCCNRARARSAAPAVRWRRRNCGHSRRTVSVHSPAEAGDARTCCRTSLACGHDTRRRPSQKKAPGTLRSTLST